MNHPTQPAIDESLHATARGLTAAEDVVETIVSLLTGEGIEIESQEPDGGSIVRLAQRNSDRAHKLADRLAFIRGLLSAPKVQAISGDSASIVRAQANAIDPFPGRTVYTGL